VLEIAFGVLVGCPRSLHDAVQRQELDHAEHPHDVELGRRVLR
jgi:hypothetical protein